MLHVPLLRRGRPYRSLDVARAPHHATGQPFAEISQANVGLIRRDLLAKDAMRASLLQFSTADLIAMTRAAAPIFLNDTLPMGDAMHGPDDYVRHVSATTGMPFAMVRRTMERVASVMQNVGDILRGLTRGLDLSRAGSRLWRGAGSGDELLSQDPGARHRPAQQLAGRAWTLGTGDRVEDAARAAARQRGAVDAVPHHPGADEGRRARRRVSRTLPSDHAGAGEIVRRCGRSMFFGDVGAVGAFAGDPRIELHGPGYSKVVFGADRAPRWAESLDLMVKSIADNGGRSCVNASGVWTPSHGRELAEGLAARLAEIVPRAEDDPLASIAPFVDRRVAARINEQIEAGLLEPGAEDVSARHRSGPAPR